MDDVGGQRRADETVRAVGVVMEADLQREQPVLTEIEALFGCLLLKIPQMEFAPIFKMADFLQIETGHEGVRRGPFRTDHDVMTRLVPEVVRELDAAHRVLPAADDVEVLVEM